MIYDIWMWNVQEKENSGMTSRIIIIIIFFLEKQQNVVTFTETDRRRPSLKGTDQIFSLGLQKFRFRVGMWRFRTGIGIWNFAVMVEVCIVNVRCIFKHYHQNVLLVYDGIQNCEAEVYPGVSLSRKHYSVERSGKTSKGD